MRKNHSGNITLDVNHLMADRVGYQYGISRETIEDAAEQARAAYEAVDKARGTGWLGWTELPYHQEEILQDIEETAKRIQTRFDAFVVLGIGGSALGPIAVHQALKHLHYNEGTREQRGHPRFYVEDNIDPERMKALLDVIDLPNTCFNIITMQTARAADA
jgi:glucose-6-phosphate isomerase